MTMLQKALSIFIACLIMLGHSFNVPLFGASPAYATAVQVATPTFSPAAGTYSSHPSVTISCSTVGATIRYTTYGGEPTSASPQYTGPIPITITTTLKAKAFKWNMADSNTGNATYVINNSSTVAMPTFSPAPGNYPLPQNVTLSSTTVGAIIRYTTNGSEPTAASTQYSGPIYISTTTATLKAKAFKSGMTESNTNIASYTIGNPSTVATPTFSLAGGTYSSTQNITINCSTAGAIIRYTTYGGEPTSASPQYTGPIPVVITTTLKAKAFKWDLTDSGTAVATYTIERP